MVIIIANIFRIKIKVFLNLNAIFAKKFKTQFSLKTYIFYPQKISKLSISHQFSSFKFHL